MGVFAAVSLPLAPARRAGAYDIARDIVQTYPGTRNVALDDASGVVTFELHFPGNLSGLVQRLGNRSIAVGDRAGVSVPVTSLVPERITSDIAAAQRVVDGPDVWDAQFPRGSYVLSARLTQGRVEASIEPRTEAMHQIYDSLLSLGLVVQEAGTPLNGAS
jgi:hypothetical protein